MGTTKSKLLHRNPYGVRMLREDYKKRSQVKVLSEYIGKHRLLRSYRFNLGLF